MVSWPRVNENGSLAIRSGVTIPAEEIEWRVTTSGGPGGQHANRSLTRVVATLRLDQSNALAAGDRERLVACYGSVVRTSAGRFRSQVQNRRAALEQLAHKLALALEPVKARRATKPTKGSTLRRVDQKKARGQLKVQRRRPSED